MSAAYLGGWLGISAVVLLPAISSEAHSRSVTLSPQTGEIFYFFSTGVFSQPTTLCSPKF